jgi:ABC-type glycerol-3-phosphate transport system substrate-binding protein
VPVEIRTMKKRFVPNKTRNSFTLLAILLAVSLSLSGCGEINFTSLLRTVIPPTQAANSNTPLTTASAQAQLTPTQPAATATPSGPQTYFIWVPPQFDPQLDTAASRQLQARLNQFMDENSQVIIEVRVKAATGPGSLLDSLTLANAAANPESLPVLVALPRSDMEVAALKGLIFPMDDLTSVIDQNDWFEYARQLAILQGATYGIPFAGDAMLLLYRPARVGAAPTTWEDILSRGQPLSFPAADPQSLLTLLLYQSSGGSIVDLQGRPTLSAETLSRVLELYADGALQGTFPSMISNIQSDTQAWQLYQDKTANMVITWSSRYLSELPVDTAAVPITSLANQEYTLATGWMWALSDPLPERRAVSVKLAEYLSESEYLTQWAPASGYLPVRPSGLNAISNQSLRGLLGRVIQSSSIRPTNDLITGVGPLLQESTLAMIERLSEPVQAANTAAERLNSP